MPTKQKADRIYIFVPRMLDIDGLKTAPMSNGRAAAQCSHVIASLVETGLKFVPHMTTIILAAENSSHLEQISKAVLDLRLPFYTQFDTFEDSKQEFLQAIAIGPITKKQSEIFKLSALW